MWAALVAACGKVADAPPAPAADAALDAFACASDRQLCGTSCIDPTSDMMNCGGCGQACQAGLQTCQAGACVATVATCQDILAEDSHATDGTFLLPNGSTINCDFSGSTCGQIRTKSPTAQSGPYTKMDGSILYCDMTTGQQIVGVSYGEYSMAYTGYRMLALTDYQSAGLQQTFIHFFNAQAGAPLIATWSIGNCCIKYDASSSMLFLGSGDSGIAYVEPGFCSAMPQATATISVFTAGVALTAQTPPLPMNFFTVYPPSSGAACGVSTNPAYFWQEAP